MALLKIKCYSCYREYMEEYPIKPYCRNCHSEDIAVTGYLDNGEHIEPIKLGMHTRKGTPSKK